jgi:uncharacterized protein involved in outer membrane biogenesis
MADSDSSRSALITTGRERARTLYRSHRLRKTMLVLAVLLLIFGALGFFAAPGLIRTQLQTRLGTMLNRPVTIGQVHLNPFTLKLELDRLHIGERAGGAPFVDVDRLTVNVAWRSLFRRAPVLDALTVEHPQLHVTRTAPQQFNFSDLIESFAGQPAAPDAPPTRFALSNIRLQDGDIVFDDRVQNATHHVDRIELGIPFLANLPHAAEVFVKPLLAMRIDGSALRIEGQTKPFANSHESVMSFAIDHLDLPRYLGYVPVALPVVVRRGQLSGQLQLHFVSAQPTPQLRLDGKLQLEQFALADHGGAPLLELGQAQATLDDVEPLLSRYGLGNVQLDQLALHYVLGGGGRSNFDALMGGDAKPGESPTEVRIASVALQDSRFDYVDRSGPKAATLALSNLHGTLNGLSTVAAPVGGIDLAAQLADGTVRVIGKLDMVASRYTGKLDLKGVKLAPLLPLAPRLLNAEVIRGSLDVDGQLQADWSKALNVHLEPANIAVNDLALDRRGRTPVSWQALNIAMARLDLATSEAQLDTVALHGLKLDARRLRDGRIDLANLFATTPGPATGHGAATPGWRWSIRHVVVDGSALAYADFSTPDKPARAVVKADKFGIDGLSSNTHQPVKINLAGGIGRGRYRVSGSVKPQPLAADLQVNISRLNAASLQSLIDVPLNVNISSALVSANGHARYRERRQTPVFGYRGRLTLSRVRVQDKLSGEDFLRWKSLTAHAIDIRMGESAPSVSIGKLALDDFYARVIVNANGRLNLQDVVASPATAPVSVTQAQTQAVPAPTPPLSAATPAAASTTTGPAAEIQIGEIALAGGQLNYTDNFIKPNYTANITQLSGTVGAFGTTGGDPAALALQGQLDDNAPVDISGTINPLAPTASLDVKAKADGVELTHLSPYSGKYAGYPITKGRLTMDVHYLLDQGKLTADNHIFIDQLTFGDRMEGPGISHLPVKLAVALLKNSQGQIDVHVPVSGSLDDPHFSVGSLVWHAFVNLIGRAVTSPFRLLASAMGGKQQDLGYVEFAPGSADLDTQAKTRLAGIVKILQDKPSLKLDIIGRVDRKFDEGGLRKVMLQELVLGEMPHDGGDAPPPKPGTESYDRYLKRAYKHAKFDKPRDFVGLTKSQPPDVMAKMLEDHVPVDDDAMRHLAERRADAVRRWLHGKVDDERVFAVAPKLDSKGIDDTGKTTRVDFGLH